MRQIEIPKNAIQKVTPSPLPGFWAIAQPKMEILAWNFFTPVGNTYLYNEFYAIHTYTYYSMFSIFYIYKILEILAFIFQK